MIAIPIAASTLDEALRQVPLAEPIADLIEFRLDYLTDFSPDDPLPCVNQLVQTTNRPVILTYHPNLRQPAREAPSLQPQATLWKALFGLAEKRPIYFDLDLTLVEWFYSEQEPVPWERIIASYHNFDETPVNLVDIYAQMAAKPAAILKMATLAQDISDNLNLFALLQRAQRENRQLIALAMGEAGLMSRILSPAWGGFLTFGSLTIADQTAPGQLTAHELRHLYRVPELTAEFHITGIIGNPVHHSLSPLIHNTAFKQLELEWVYLPLLVRDLDRFMNDFVNPYGRQMDWNLRGLSVTIPHKIEMLKYLDRLDSIAEKVGAVNTLVVEGDELVGYNTDVEGAMRPLRERLELRGAQAVVLGAGGAARAVAYGLQQEGAQVMILARNAGRARDLAERVGGRSGWLSDLANIEYDLLINATPIGMEGAPDESPVSPHALRQGAIVFDLAPRQQETKLLRDARAAGCRTIRGLEMLVYQAARQFELWTHQTAPVEMMFQTVWPALEP